MALSIQHLHAGYEKHRVLIDVNLTVALREWVALLGPNASGKTTLLHCVVGMMAPVSGSIAVCGHSFEGGGQSAKSKLGFRVCTRQLAGTADRPAVPGDLCGGERAVVDFARMCCSWRSDSNI